MCKYILVHATNLSNSITIFFHAIKNFTITTVKLQKIVEKKTVGELMKHLIITVYAH